MKKILLYAMFCLSLAVQHIHAAEVGLIDWQASIMPAKDSLTSRAAHAVTKNLWTHKHAITKLPHDLQNIIARYWIQDNWCTLINHSKPLRSIDLTATSLIFSPNCCVIAAYSTRTNKVRLLDCKGTCLAVLQHKALVHSVEFSPDGNVIAIRLSDNTVKLWNLKGACLATLPHDDFVGCVHFSPDSRIVATCTSSCRPTGAKLWDLSGTCLATLPHEESSVEYVEFSPDSTTIVTHSSNSTKLWNFHGTCLATLQGCVGTFCSRYCPVRSAVFLSDGKVLTVTCSRDGIIKVSDLQGVCLATLPYKNLLNVKKIEFSRDGKKVLIYSKKTLQLWDFESNSITALPYDDYSLLCVAFSPDTEMVALCSYHSRKQVALWDSAGTRLAILQHRGEINRFVFSPDGTKIATCSNDRTAKLWNLQGACLATLPHDNYVSSVRFSPDGTMIATGSDDKTAKLWDLSGTCLATLPHTHRVGEIFFSPDALSIVTRSNKAMRLWDFNLRHYNIQQLAELDERLKRHKRDIDQIL